MIYIEPGVHADLEQIDRLEKILKSDGLEYRILPSEKESLSMKQLVEQSLPANEQRQSDENSASRSQEVNRQPDAPLLYLSSMNQPEISSLFSRLEEEGLNDLLMAVQTSSNMEWTCQQLRSELEREAAYFQKREELAGYLERADRVRLMQDEDYRNCLMLAASLLREDDLSERMLDKALEVMRTFDA